MASVYCEKNTTHLLKFEVAEKIRHAFQKCYYNFLHSFLKSRNLKCLKSEIGTSCWLFMAIIYFTLYITAVTMHRTLYMKNSAFF